RFVRKAKAAGFAPIWGPIRVILDKISADDAAFLSGLGLAGVGVQEQNYLKQACPTERMQALKALRQKFAPTDSTGSRFVFNVQMMSLFCKQSAPSSCGQLHPEYNHCVEFARLVREFGGQIGIWTNARDDSAADAPNFFRVLRAD